MALNRILVTSAQLDAITAPVVGQCRIWKQGLNAGDPAEPTGLYLLYLETPPEWTIGTVPGARVIPNGEVAHCDGKIKDVFTRSGVNVLDYGPTVQRSFVMDIIVGRGVAARLGA